MAGAAFELAASHVDWLLGAEGAAAAAALRRIVDGSQGPLASSSPGAARSTREPIVAALAEAWDEAMAALDAAVA